MGSSFGGNMDIIDVAIAKKFTRDLAGPDRTYETVKGNTDRMSLNDRVFYEGIEYSVSSKIRDGQLVTSYKEIV